MTVNIPYLQTSIGRNSPQPRILIVDDDPAICQLISRFFSYNNYYIESAVDAKTARQLFQKFNPDLAILDVNLPDESGFNLCKEIRQTGTLVLMLTCMTDTSHVLEGFEQGADDYLTKPFNLEILKAKIAALLKRRNGGEVNLNTPNNSVSIEGLTIDPNRCEVSLNHEVLPLTSLEFELLYFLATHPNRVWERSDLIAAVWGNHHEIGAERKVDVHIGQIRKKINDIQGKLIKTVRGKGYLFERSESD
ncbi:two-component response regulator [Crocosphaera subtropica ATCC 51142]|uniref:Two-component response regulator n=1 Tax=Crocosphaera subtropica (strain ATCC 51142 / BH68) TaxID=43989 RepID=B1WTP9_CROS5|nr:response regulator transcription factor [Crocosphaera subtropica]ACB53764.1 two-component response regulator [Crocosphaera subtropica ATCC 51142]